MSEEKKVFETSASWILNYVRDLMDEVKQYPVEQRDHVKFHGMMAQKHQTFFAKFPHLLTMVCDDGDKFDIAQLEEMLEQREEINRGEKDLEEANKEMGQKYFDKHVSPHIDWEKEHEARRKKSMKSKKSNK